MAQSVKDIIKKLEIKINLYKDLESKQILMNGAERMAFRELRDSIISDTTFIANKRSQNGKVASHSLELRNEGEVTFKDCFVYFVRNLMK